MKLLNIFDKMAKRNSSKIAVCDENGSFTYQALYEQSNQIAQQLLTLGAKKGDRVGILAERSRQLIISILGVIKAGAAYLPIDLDYPLDRILYMLESSNVKILIVDNQAERLLIELTGRKNCLEKVVFLDQWIPLSLTRATSWDLQSKLERENLPKTSPKIEIVERDSVVVFFTSGSTGKPKGVELSWGAYSNNFENMQKILKFDEKSHIAQMASGSFDISITELWMPLLYGARIYIASDQIKKNPWQFAEWINTNAIEFIQFVPSLFHHFLIALADQGITFPTIRKLLFIGEELRSQYLKEWYESFASSECLVYNLYGPVEAAIEVSAFKIDKNTLLKNEVVPIGVPFKNIEFIIEDEDGIPSNRGMLYIRGSQLAKGYLDPTLTAQAFRNARYETGDIVEILPDGNYSFITRRDRQVKIRGFRIELGEIESALCTHPEILQAAVISERNGEYDKIVAFITGCKNGDEASSYLKQLLPNYMLPHQIIPISAIPLNTNGKINYHELSSMLVRS